MPAYRLVLQIGTLFSTGSLFALTGLRQFFVEPLANPLPNLSWFLLQVAPLLLMLPGILRARPRSYLLATLVSMLYFVHGVLLASTAELRALGLSETGFALALLFSAGLMLKDLSRPGEEA